MIYVFRISDNKIHITRGDKCTLNVGASFNDKDELYTFKVGDIISFSVYNKKGLDKEPLLKKEMAVSEETTRVSIPIYSEDTRFGPVINKVKVYWYEVQLNHDQTLIGYDDDGPKELYLYPEGDYDE